MKKTDGLVRSKDDKKTPNARIQATAILMRFNTHLTVRHGSDVDVAKRIFKAHS
jgi:hypothetical protein